eukprot:2918099-Alexandrium_andersonii.AAC.1
MDPAGCQQPPVSSQLDWAEGPVGGAAASPGGAVPRTDFQPSKRIMSSGQGSADVEGGGCAAGLPSGGR